MIDSFALEDRALLRGLVERGLDCQCIFDIGGAYGGWTSAVKEFFPDTKFELFEPLGQHCEDYRSSLQQLIESDPKCRIHVAAIGAKSGTCTMNVFPDPVGSTSLKLQYAIPDVTQVTVPQYCIDDLVKRHGLMTPQLIKIDIQGGEIAALQGARQTLKKVEVLLLETWMTRAYGKHTPLFHELVAFLAGVGFYVAEFGDEYRDPAGRLVAKDCLFINVNSPLSEGV